VVKQTKYHVGIEIDKLTNSIVNTISGDSFPTDVYPITKVDLKNITKKNGWLFNWANEFKLTDRHVFKLTIRNNPEIIQGLLSISDYNDHYYLHLIESSPFNLGKTKLYEGVQAIYLHSLVRHLGRKVIKVSYPSHPRQS
jgi:hypothetical protein